MGRTSTFICWLLLTGSSLPALCFGPRRFPGPEKIIMVAKNDDDDRPSTWRVWATAARPHTLTASVSPCLVAYASSVNIISTSEGGLDNIVNSGKLRLWWTIWLIFCLTIQLGTNLHNDYSDFVQGADTEKRVGQARATARGWLTPEQTCRAAVTVLSLTFACGLFLLHDTDQLADTRAWFVVISSIFNAFAYTGGPFPLGYIGLGGFSIAYWGLGDIFVLLYFGYAAVLFLPYLLHCRGIPVNWVDQFFWSTPVGLLGMCIIIVNNLRDRHTDVEANKRTTAVRFGRKFSLAEYFLCFTISYCLIAIHAFKTGKLLRLLPFLTLPWAFWQWRAVCRTEGKALNSFVGGAAKHQFLFCILEAVGIALTAT